MITAAKMMPTSMSATKPHATPHFEREEREETTRH
jgi:hypothetical protein